MRVTLAITCLLLIAVPTQAGDRETVIEAIGAISIAPQLCEISIDREALRAVGRDLLPEEAELTVATFAVNNRIAKLSRTWSAGDRVTFCSATRRAAADLGVLR